MLGAAATPPPDETREKRRTPEGPITRLLAPEAGRNGDAAHPEDVPLPPAENRFASAFPTQAARAALLDECVEKAQERAKLLAASAPPS
jgi:hypothetical protein